MPVLLDLLAAAFFLAGAVAWLAHMDGQSCDPSSLHKLYGNSLLNQGCIMERKGPGEYLPYCGIADGFAVGEKWSLADLWPTPMREVCHKALAEEIFHFLGLGAAIFLIILGLLMIKNRGLKRSPLPW